jgi:glycosyltransferase involved in cell wall biosynthesis
MRLALGTPYPFDEGRIHGGVESVGYNLAASLAATGEVEVHVVSLSERCREDALERRGPLTIHWIRARPGMSVLKALTVHALKVRAAYRDVSPDLVHAQHFSAYVVGAPKTYPLVLTVHGLEWFVPEMRGSRRYAGVVGACRRVAEGALIRACLSKATAVVAMPGPFVPTTLGQMLGGRSVRGIPNPLVLDRWLESSLGDDGRTVLSIGTIMRRKDQLSLMRAFAQVADRFSESRLLFIGATPDSDYLRTLHGEARSAGLEERITFLGLVEEERLLHACGSAAVVASASPVETAPMALAEAMAAGRAVVAVEAGGIPYMIQDGVSGFVVPPNDVGALARRLGDLLADSPLRRRVGSAARSRAVAMFGSVAVGQSTLSLYRQLLEA